MIFTPSEIRTLIHVATKRTGTPVRDEDLEQEVALHALEAFRRLNEVTHPRALLVKIVRDTVRDHWRRRRSSEELEGIDDIVGARGQRDRQQRARDPDRETAPGDRGFPNRDVGSLNV